MRSPSTLSACYLLLSTGPETSRCQYLSVGELTSLESSFSRGNIPPNPCLQLNLSHRSPSAPSCLDLNPSVDVRAPSNTIRYAPKSPKLLYHTLFSSLDSPGLHSSRLHAYPTQGHMFPPFGELYLVLLFIFILCYALILCTERRQ